MFLVELVMQGVRGIRQLARLRFQNGFNIIIAGNESGKTTAVDTLQRLLFPSGQAGNSLTLVSKYTPDTSRSALVICSDDGLYYRLIQDFSKCAVNLSKYNPTAKEFNLLHKDWDSTMNFMKKLTTDLSEKDYEKVFMLRREHFHERLFRGTLAPSEKNRPSLSEPVPARVPRDAASETRLAELRETLRKAEEAADADYKYQSAKLARDEINKKLVAVDEIEKKIAGTESSLAELKACENLPGNLSEVLEDHERQQGQKHADAENLRNELEGLSIRLSSIPMSSFATDKVFLLGAVVGIVSLVVGLYVLTDAHAYLFQSGVIISLVLIATAWYNSSRRSAEFRAVKKEFDTVQSELAELERDAVHGGADVTAYMSSVGVATTAELKEKAENYRHLQSMLQEQIQTRQRVLSGETADSLRQQYQKQVEDVQRLEKETQDLTQYAVDTYSIRQDIERLESDVSYSGTAGAGVSEDINFPTEFQTAPSRSWDALTELVAASRISGIAMDALFATVEAVAQRNLSAASSGRYVRFKLDNEGLIVVYAKDDTAFKFDDLSHGTKALVYFCFRAGLAEVVAGSRRVSFVVDDALTGFDPARQQAACQILRNLGAKTQVLFFTSNASLRGTNDVVAELN
jgi:hypothetical protein